MVKKPRKHVIFSVGIASALLLSGVGISTLGTWNHAAESTVNSTVNAGKLRIQPVEDTKKWYEGTATKTPISNIAGYRIVPGQTLTYTAGHKVTVIGDNLKAKLELSELTANGSLLAPVEGVKLSYGVYKATGDGSNPDYNSVVKEGELTFDNTGATPKYTSGTTPIVLAENLTQTSLHLPDTTNANYFITVKAEFDPNTDEHAKQLTDFTLQNMKVKLTQTGSEPVNMGDSFTSPIIRNAVTQAITVNGGDATNPTTTDLALVTSLNLSGQSLGNSDLTNAGLNSLPNLKTLNLANNNLTSTAGIPELTQLENLDLSRNKFTDLSGLNVADYVSLNVANQAPVTLNGETPASVTLKAPQGMGLTISPTVNGVTYSSATGVLTVTQPYSGQIKLDTTTNPVTVFTANTNVTASYPGFVQAFPDANLRAQVLTDFKSENPGNNALTSLTQTQVAGIKGLYASNKSIVNAAGVEYLTGAIHIHLYNNQLTAPPVLTGLTNLQTLELGNNRLTAPPVLTGLTNLQTLYLYSNRLTAPPVLTGLTSLQQLYLENNRLTASPVLTGLTNLQNLYLYNNQLTTPPNVTGLTNLRYLAVASQSGDNNKYRRTEIPGIMSTTQTLNPTNNSWGYVW